MMRALDLAEAVDAGDISIAAPLELAAEAIAAREAEIGAFAHLDLDRARVRASRLAMEGLYGLPVGMKDIIETAAMPTAMGSPLYARHKPKADAPIVVMTEEANGLVVGKTVTTEFAFLNPPATRNPHDPDVTPGGSSSGSAAAVAAGMLPLAFGTQTGGSMIRPASFCGVAAMKPSFRLLPMVGIKPFAPLLDTLGLFGARVVDVAFGLGAISGRSMRVDGQDFGTPRFGVMRQDFAGAAEAESEQALMAAIAAAEHAGATVIDLVPPAIFAEAHAAHRVLNNYEGAQSLAYEHLRHRAGLSPILLDALDAGAAIPIAEYDSARGLANHARKQTKAFFEPVDAVLSFSAPGVAPGRGTTGDARYNKLITMLGLPAVNVPGFRAANRLPVGVQVIGRFGDDHRTLAAAAWLERVLKRSGKTS